MEKKEPRENHHVTPLSLGGHHREENIRRIPKSDHKKIHTTQNMPFDALRGFRKRTNHLPKNSSRYKAEWFILLSRYFAKAALLPVRLIKLQSEALKVLCLALAKEKNHKLPEEPKDMQPMVELYYWLANMIVLATETFLIFSIL